MGLLLLGMLLFAGGHAVTMAREPRAAVIGRIGVLPFKALYSVVALAGLLLIFNGYAAYRAGGYTPVWEPPVALRHVSLLVMLPAFPLLLAAYFPGRIKARLKHPMILAVKTWALAHLLANGDLGSILLFGGMLAWAVAAFMSMRRRVDGNAPLVPALPERPINDVIAVGGGLALYAAMAFWLHRPLIGVGAMG
jgi:uncharacterized membrane protein